MATTTHIFLNDFVGLPIIISDFDALTSTPNPTANNEASIQTSTQSPLRQSSAASPTSAASLPYSNGTASALQQNWSTGFSDFADDLWAKMKQGMKLKLREACVEVLKKTDDAEPEQEQEHMSWQYDDDARFLD